MSMDLDRYGSEKSVTEQESTTFAATPIWERRGKKRGRKFASDTRPAPTIAPEPIAPEPRSFASERDYDEPMALDTPVHSPTASLADGSDLGLVAPIGRRSARADRGPKSKGVGPAAIAAGVVALGALGAVGWIASRGDDGIPELTPGQPVEVADASALPPVLPPVPPAADTAVNPLPSEVAAPRATVRASPPVRTAGRARPAAAAAPSAGDTGMNASATTSLPSGPQPYSTLNPGATPPPPVNPAPTQAAPPPTETPAAVPQTPPTLPADPPTDEATVTPPTS